MTVSDFKRLFAYEFWANRAVADALSPSNEAAFRLFRHILASHRLWLDRLTSQPQSLPVWPELTTAECMALLGRLEEDWSAYLDGLSDDTLSGSFDYVNTKGKAWSSTVQDTLTHLITHSSYHRGQVALRMRLAGEDPPYTDYIHATRGGLI